MGLEPTRISPEDLKSSAITKLGHPCLCGFPHKYSYAASALNGFCGFNFARAVRSKMFFFSNFHDATRHNAVEKLGKAAIHNLAVVNKQLPVNTSLVLGKYEYLLWASVCERVLAASIHNNSIGRFRK